MKQNKKITKLFEGYEIRSILNSVEEDYYFSVVDVIYAILTNEIYREWSRMTAQEYKPYKYNEDNQKIVNYHHNFQ